MNESGIYFESRAKAYFMRLWTSVVTIFSLTLLFPLCYWYQSRYIINRKTVEGKKCYFDGKLKIMYLLYIGFLALDIGIIFLIYFLYKKAGIDAFENIPANIITALTMAITHFFVATIQEIYVQKHTHFVGEQYGKSGYYFKFWMMLFKTALTKITNTMFLGLLYPITHVINYRYSYKRGYYDDIKLDYKFSLKGLYPRWFLDLLLIVITLGLYIPAASNRLDERCQKHAHLLKEDK